jgi:CheY-like chemotaxis protein
VVKPSRVLVVDDDAEMRALLLDVLEKDGYEVAEATDGAQLDPRNFSGTRNDLMHLKEQRGSS